MQVRRSIGGWGRWPVIDADVVEAAALEPVRAAIRAGSVGVRGAGRSYGDSSLAERVIDMSRFSRLRSFDPTAGVVTAQAGVTIDELLRIFGPRGWFPPVTPGTRFVTLGGALASDVHGKNHHVGGSFADHVQSFELLLGSGEVITVTPETEPALFRATAGGMGLTGVILSVTLRMLPVTSSRILQRSLKLRDLDATLAAIEAHARWTYSAAWIDCQSTGASLGRSLLLLGEHAPGPDLSDMAPAQRTPAVPFDLPSRALSRPVVSLFNSIYHARQRADCAVSQVPYASFFYPLDVAGEWNRLYGRRGFVQYQFVTPAAAGPEPLVQALRLITAARVPAPLAVLKAFGPANDNLLSFPLAGHTLAVDFPATDRVLTLLQRLDELVLGCGGRIYLSKDSRMSPETFRASYPRWEEFEEIRAGYGASGRFATLQSRRLGLA